MNAVNIQSSAGAWQGGMLSDFVSWAPPSVLIRWTEPFRMILCVSLLGRAKLWFLLCCGCQGENLGLGRRGGKKGALDPC